MYRHIRKLTGESFVKVSNNYYFIISPIYIFLIEEGDGGSWVLGHGDMRDWVRGHVGLEDKSGTLHIHVALRRGDL